MAIKKHTKPKKAADPKELVALACKISRNLTEIEEIQVNIRRVAVDLFPHVKLEGQHLQAAIIALAKQGGNLAFKTDEKTVTQLIQLNG